MTESTPKAVIVGAGGTYHGLAYSYQCLGLLVRLSCAPVATKSRSLHATFPMIITRRVLHPRGR